MQTYDPGQIVVSFSGNLLTGLAETFVSAERSEDAWSLAVGADGKATRVRNRNQSGEVTITLQASSPANDILTALAKADELSGIGVAPLFIKDLRGTTLVSGPRAWIKKMPSVEFGKELSDREWVFGCDPLDINAGGSLP